MKKLFALLMVAGFAFAFVACGGADKKEEPAQDTTAVAPAPAPDTTATDTTAAQ